MRLGAVRALLNPDGSRNAACKARTCRAVSCAEARPHILQHESVVSAVRGEYLALRHAGQQRRGGGGRAHRPSSAARGASPASGAPLGRRRAGPRERRRWQRQRTQQPPQRRVRCTAGRWAASPPRAQPPCLSPQSTARPCIPAIRLQSANIACMQVCFSCCKQGLHADTEAWCFGSQSARHVSPTSQIA